MTEIKGLILAAGEGSRLFPITYTRAKPLVPVAGRPILVYVVEKLRAVGIKHIGVVVNPLNGPEIESYLQSSYPEINWQIIVQQQPLGLAHAVKVSHDFLKDSPFVMLLGDNLFSASLEELVSQMQSTKPDCVLQLREVKDPRAFGVAEVNGTKVIRLVEKPNEPRSNLAIAGIYGFSSKIFETIDTIKPSARGELEITDAIQALIEQNGNVVWSQLKGWWKDTGRREDLLSANSIILSSLNTENNGILKNCVCNGNVYIGKNSVIKRSCIRGPVWIGDNCLIKGADIGPNVAIGNGCFIKDCEIEDSILMDGVEIHGLIRVLCNSVIGNRCKLLNDRKGRTKLTLFLSDRSYIDAG